MRVQPPVTSPFALVKAKWNKTMAAMITYTDNASFENFLIQTAYRMFAMYSKNSDHPTLFKGCISCQPRMSMDNGMGSTVYPMSITSSSFHTGTVCTRGRSVESVK